MNKNVIKIVIKTSISVVLIGISMLLLISIIIEKSGESYGLDSNLEYAYGYGNYEDILNSFIWYDATAKKYDDDWKVAEANKLRYDYKVYEKIYNDTADEAYAEKMKQAKEEMEACINEIDDEYKQEVVKIFLKDISQ